MGTTLQCGQCGAPLRPEAVQNGMVRCEYCGAVTKVNDPAQPTPQSSASVHVPPPSVPPVVLSVGDLGKTAATGIKVAGIISVVVGLLVPLGIGLAIYFMVNKTRDATQRRINKAQARAAALQQKMQEKFGGAMRRGKGPAPIGNAGACLVQANSDAVADVALLWRANPKDEKSTLKVHFFDGVTGKHLTESAALGGSHDPKLICLGPRYVGVQGADLKLHILSSTTPNKMNTILLGDRVDKVATNSTCARIKTDDGATKQIRLSTGETVKCKAGPLEKITKTPGMPTFKKVRIFKKGPVKYRIEAKRQGIPFLQVSAKQGRKLLWKWKLDITATSYGIPAVITPNTLVLVGASYPEKDFAILGGLALSTGQKRYAVRLKGHGIATFGVAIQYNGKWVLLRSYANVTAFDPDTGKLVWRLD